MAGIGPVKRIKVRLHNQQPSENVLKYFLVKMSTKKVITKQAPFSFGGFIRLGRERGEILKKAGQG